MARKCPFTGKRPQVANHVSHSNIKTKRRQLPNLQYRRLWLESEQRFIQVRLTTSALRNIDKLGLEAYARQAGVDLSQF